MAYALTYACFFLFNDLVTTKNVDRHYGHLTIFLTVFQSRFYLTSSFTFSQLYVHACPSLCRTSITEFPLLCCYNMSSIYIRNGWLCGLILICYRLRSYFLSRESLIRSCRMSWLLKLEFCNLLQVINEVRLLLDELNLLVNLVPGVVICTAQCVDSLLRQLLLFFGVHWFLE